MELVTLSFRSLPVEGFDLRTLQGVVESSRDNNIRDEVTSMLYYDGDYLLQTLEGPCDRLLACFRRIQQDERHFQVLPFAIERIPERRLPNHCFKVIIDDSSELPISSMRCFPYRRREVLTAIQEHCLQRLRDGASAM